MSEEERDVEREEIRKVLRKLKDGKAMGVDLLFFYQFFYNDIINMMLSRYSHFSKISKIIVDAFPRC